MSINGDKAAKTLTPRLTFDKYYMDTGALVLDLLRELLKGPSPTGGIPEILDFSAWILVWVISAYCRFYRHLWGRWYLC